MKSFKVLTIDGGGIKGLYSATILRHIEADLRRTHGDAARIVDYADLICGTSTGGLIALGLALRIPVERICEFYENKGARIFKGSQGLPALFRQTFLGGKFSDKLLRRALEDMFEEQTIADSHCLLCIPTYDFTNGTYGVFKFDHTEGNLCRHNPLRIVDVALATSAAPTFFPIAEITEENCTQYVDGGVWANNPSLVGLAEAIWHFVGAGRDFDHVNLLSVASLYASAGKAPLLKRRRGFVRWAKDLFDLSLIAQSEFADVFLTLMHERQIVPMTYTRIPSAVISSEQVPFIKLDLASAKSFSLMKQLAVDTYHKYRKNASVQDFFQEPKSYKLKS